MHRERSESRNVYKGNINRHRRVHAYMGVDEDMVIERSEQDGKQNIFGSWTYYGVLWNP